ncbi:MAG TPA: hypothetical protein VKH81_04405 [Candidatus Angelobacter sp.]|nr:hypothetical protein [Candidatus Angelobacter sp.]
MGAGLTKKVEAMRRAHRLSSIVMFILFGISEAIVLSNFWGRREMHLDIYAVCLLPILVAIPLAAALQIRRKLRTQLGGLDPAYSENFQYLLTSLTAIFYGVLTSALSLLLNALVHLSRHYGR